MRPVRHILIVFLLLGFVSCIENDLSYPDVVTEITGFAVEGQKGVTIDKSARSVSIVLEETADMTDLKVLDCTLSNGGEVVGGIPERLDLTDTVNITLRLYEETVWTISATQPIERYIRCDNQVGEAEIDPVRKIAYVYVTEDQSLLDVRVNAVKLEPEGSVVTTTTGFISQNGQSVPKVEACSFPMVLDCVIMRYFTVEYGGEEIEWSVKFLQKKVDVAMESVNAWTYSAEVAGITNGRGTPVFECRKASAPEWTSCPDVTVNGTYVTATLTGLDEDTDYLVRIGNGDEYSKESAFRTGRALQLDNMSFDQWHQGDPNGSWYPFAEGTEGVWGTANPGTNFMNPINPTKPEYTHVAVPGGTAVRLESMKAFGVFAAGNVFSGRFVEFSFSSMAAKLLWGTPFTERPYSLKGYYDYAPVRIDVTQEKVSGMPNPYKDLYGSMDNMQILAVLVAEADDEADKGPFPVISTKPGVPDLKNDPRVIAYGTIESDVDTGGQYREFECVLDYYDDRTPAYVIVVACSSLRGNYFTGGLGSVLYVDDFSFSYR